MGDILSDPLARARTFGTDSVLATRAWTAVKTGTSKDMRDNWAVGYSQAYTVGVWVGNASGAPMWDVSGTTGAAPIWAATMNYLHARQPSRAPKPPPGVVQAPVQFTSSSNPASTSAAVTEAARQEWFVADTQQSLFAMKSGAATALSTGSKPQNAFNNQGSSARITSPTNGTILALDPDIPPQAQRLAFNAEGSGLRWKMDGKVFATGSSAQWLPWPGRHVVQIVDSRGRVQDEIKIEVRGAGVASSAR